MPRDSQFTEAVLQYMEAEGRPVTATEIQESVGMSRQAAYQWLDSNAWRVREVGKGRHGAKAFILAKGNVAWASNFVPRGVERVPERGRAPVPDVLSGVPEVDDDERDRYAFVNVLGHTLTVFGIRLVSENNVIFDVEIDTGQIAHAEVTVIRFWHDRPA